MSLATRVADLATAVGKAIPVFQEISVSLDTTVGTRGRATVTLPIPIDGTRPYLATVGPAGLSVSTQVMPVGTVSHPGTVRVEQLDVATTSLIASAGTITWVVQVIGYPAP